MPAETFRSYDRDLSPFHEDLSCRRGERHRRRFLHRAPTPSCGRPFLRARSCVDLERNPSIRHRMADDPEPRAHFDLQRNCLRNLEPVASIAMVSRECSGKIPQSREQLAGAALPQQHAVARVRVVAGKRDAICRRSPISHEQNRTAHIDRRAPCSHLRNAINPAAHPRNTNSAQRTFFAARILWRTSQRTQLHLRLIDRAGIACFDGALGQFPKLRTRRTGVHVALNTKHAR